MLCNICNKNKKEDLFTFRRNSEGNKKYKPTCKKCHSKKVSEYQTKKRIEKGLKKPGPKKKNRISVLSKKCKICNIIKNIVHFTIRNDSVDYHRNECKDCKKTINNEYYKITYNKIRNDRKKNDIEYRITCNMRNYVYKAIKYKYKKSLKYLDCDLKILKKWLEFQFDSKMNWDNYGKYWNIDHIIPINFFNLKNKNEQDICFNWKNMQPLKVSENFIKKDKIIGFYLMNNIVSLNRFISKYNLDYEYQNIKKTLYWLREKLRYGKNFADDLSTIKILNVLNEMGNPQPSS